MRDADAYATKKAEAKNAFEEGLINIQRKVEEQPEVFDPVKKENLRKVVDAMEEFLYEEDDDYKIEDYCNKLDELKKCCGESMLPGLNIEEAPSDAEAMDTDPVVEEPTQ